MYVGDQINADIRSLFRIASDEKLDNKSFTDICEHLGVAKMYYDMDLGGEERYRDHRSGNLVMAEKEADNKIILYDNGEKTDLKMTYPYYYYGAEYVHAYIEFKEGITREDIDDNLFQFLADLIYLLVSRRNMRLMLDYAETVDALTGIPNVVFMKRQFEQITQTIPPQEFLVIRVNIQNFKYMNEVGGSLCGDEAMIKYSRMLVHLIDEDEGVCRLGGDNFAFYIHKEHMSDLIEKLNNVVLTDLKYAPGRSFEMMAWIGVSELKEGEHKVFGQRLGEASSACDIAKGQLKQQVVYFNNAIVNMIDHGHDIIAMFRPAVRNREFHPFFQPKVDMRTGKLVGFEALCRWIHDGKFIFPDQFIPIIDKAGLIPDLDMAIFDRTCACIRQWKDMGLNPPRISTNFSRKNLFVQDIEEKILGTIKENGLTTDDLEIEITESVKVQEYDRLIEFVKYLKNNGVHIAIDDFGTGYSSLSLIHNVDVDIIKIDKSFVDNLLDDDRSRVLSHSIISIADKLGIGIIAEGVETREQGEMLLKLGCNVAQGYYYGKPVDYNEATEIIKNSEFEPIQS
ncbi:MAG: GGDEF domain-containing protein [Lachnospiraceae bacterium]|nr:GGDEF domain-containing protein [Lachnospiraceae bacterium]